MRINHVLFLLVIALLGQSCNDSNLENSVQVEAHSAYTDSINLVRSKNDVQLREEEGSPIMKEKLASFKGLKYFEADEKWRIHAKYTKIENGELFSMPTTTERMIEMVKDGQITFNWEGKTLELNAYAYVEYPDESLFVPFLDQTNGDLTYGGGRYLDINRTTTDSIWVDFNMAYNPYCAYNHSYSCPIPPLENTLDIEILAGEKVLYTY